MARKKDISDLINFKTNFNDYFSNTKYVYYSIQPSDNLINEYLEAASKKETEGFKDFVNNKSLYQLSNSDNSIQFLIKIVDIVNKNISKIEGLLRRLGDTDIFWKKLQQDFQIPKEQIELLRQEDGSTIEEKLANFAANYSYTVEINTAKDVKGTKVSYDEEGEPFGEYDTIEGNSKFYSNLTVPGGTNYTEQEIATPAITPSIKGHAQFATDNGIGWFRSDDLAQDSIEKEKIIRKQYDELKPENITYEQYKLFKGVESGGIVESSKTRRILEVQSDWGQKQRKSSEPDINIKYDVQQIINDLQKSGDLKIDCN